MANYETVPLRGDEITIGVIQSRVRTVDIADSDKGEKRNLEHMLSLIDQVAVVRSQCDLLIFHEFPLSGLNRAWNRKQVYEAMAIDVPGEETELIGQKAKQYNIYIEFGCYAREKGWPNHFINMGVIVAPSGKVIYKHWKSYNTAGRGFSSTVYDVLDEYVKRYGWDAVFPVARTDIGNIAIVPCVKEPELLRAYAMKGCEIMIRYMTNGGGHWSTSPSAFRGGGSHTFGIDLQAGCIQNSFYGVFVNDAVDIKEDLIWDYGCGYSAVYDPNGDVIAQASSPHETIFSVTIPMANYRKKHSIPDFHKELYAQLYQEYQPKYPANSFLKYLPDSMADAGDHYEKVKNW